MEEEEGVKVVIIFDTSREFCHSAVLWALDRVAQPGSCITLLGILHEVLTPMGYKSRVGFMTFNGVNLKSLEEEAAKTGTYYSLKWEDLASRCEEMKVKLEVRIIAGHPLGAIAAAETKKLQASWVILDKNLKRHERYLADNLPCNVVLMNRSNEGKIVKLSEPVLLGPSFHLRKLPSGSSIFAAAGLSTTNSLNVDVDEHEQVKSYNQIKIRQFTLEEIEEATENFSQDNFISDGGFGHVFKGVIMLDDNRRLTVAVKRHKLGSCQGDREFQAEVQILSSIKHENFVTLVGYCTEDGHKILVYEYVSNGTLAWHLSAKSPDVLPWAARHIIAVGIAKALHHLHHYCAEGSIVHRDVQPHNILLEPDFTPKLGDFGLAKWEKDPAQEATTLIAATGYIAPEYAATGLATEKVDIYAFGIVLLEIITGRRAVSNSMFSEQKGLVEWARPKLQTRDARSLLDPGLRDDCDEYEVQSMIHAAAFCLQPDPQRRLSINQIMRILVDESENAETI